MAKTFPLELEGQELLAEWRNGRAAWRAVARVVATARAKTGPPGRVMVSGEKPAAGTLGAGY
ncbi:MAG: hypothetical protein NTV86_21140 [Planctomycetota bacterium]|nr:hypothetical protein [Planctomycetota bacterium]